MGRLGHRLTADRLAVGWRGRSRRWKGILGRWPATPGRGLCQPVLEKGAVSLRRESPSLECPSVVAQTVPGQGGPWASAAILRCAPASSGKDGWPRASRISSFLAWQTTRPARLIRAKRTALSRLFTH